MARVTGIGGIFYTAENPSATRAWYSELLGVPMSEHCWDFQWRERESPEVIGHTVWSPFAQDTKYFAPSEKPFMVNLRVEDLDGLLRRLEAAGVKRVGDIIEESNGRFAYVLDPDGVKLELWEPIDQRVPIPRRD